MSADKLLQIESGTEFHIPWKIDRHELVSSRMVQKGIVAKRSWRILALATDKL